MWLYPPATLLPARDTAHNPIHSGQSYTITTLQSDLPLHSQAGHPTSNVNTPIPFNITKATSSGSPSLRPKKCFRCPFPGCQQTSSNKGNLSKHIATRHEHRKDFACPFKGCNRKFAKKFNMLRHLSASGVHRGAKPEDETSFEDVKWTSIELDLAKFLAKQCQNNQLLHVV